MIVKELQNVFGEIYLGGKKTIVTDVFFIMEKYKDIFSDGFR